MAGVNTVGDEGTEVREQKVPAIGGDMTDGGADVVASVHLTDEPRAEGVAYNSDASIGENLGSGGAYPKGTDFGEANNPLKP